MARLLIVLLSILLISTTALAEQEVLIKDNVAKTLKSSSNSCGDCHPDIVRKLDSSVHGNKDKSPYDHPNCISCHPGDPHSHKPGRQRTSNTKACSKCHAKPNRMRQYAISTNAVESYKRSYHGKAFLHFGKRNSATCVDCHGSHTVLSPLDKSSPVSNANASRTCKKCHPRVKSNFYSSGANHLQVAMDESVFLKAESIFFRVLTIGIMLFLVSIVSLDLRKKVFCKTCRPKSGRLAAVLIAVSFYSLVIGIVLAAYSIRIAKCVWIIWAVSLVLAFVAYVARAKKTFKNRPKRYYNRFTVSQRLQHLLLAASFTVLVLTGMPLRFSDVGWTNYLNSIFGGFAGARIAHRVGAAVLILTSLWHLIYLFLSWRKAGYSLKSCCMLPTRRDLHDLVATFRLDVNPPDFDRFSFREKFDYFAVFWGIPIMVVSGLIMAFPFTIGSHLPPIALAAALIAHSDEALLAMLAIIVWHFYNVHLDPDNFPANNSWLTGKLSETDMEREHPLEKARIDAKQSTLEDSEQS